MDTYSYICYMKKRTDKEMAWKVLDSESIISRPWLTARRDRVELPGGQICNEFYVLSYPTWVNTIALTADGRMIVERQYRHAIGKVCTEICAGVVEAGELPIEAARRELLEETGYTGGSWQELMVICPNPGSMDNYCHCFLARGVEPTAQQHLEETEDIEVLLKTQTEVYAMLKRGEFLQALMVAPLWRFFAGEAGMQEE